jgi:hypothetical protein
VKELKHIGIHLRALVALYFLFLFFPLVNQAQTVNRVYIFPGASLVAHPNSNLNIFSDISHSGSLTSYTSSFINFYGGVWQNNNGSRLPDESVRGIDGTGGIFTFSDLLQNAQRINNINAQPFNGFPNLRLDNSLNVLSDIGNLHVNNNLDFRKGHLVLNGFDVNVGRPGTGIITGHSHTNFVVTGTKMTGGSLVRNTTASSPALDFPVGTAIGSYTPLSIKYTGLPQVIKFRVADSLYNKPNFPEYLNKTWIMNTSNADPSATVELTLQHNAADEASRYLSKRTDAYITRYDTRMTGLWDVLPPMATSTPGIITDRAAIFDAYMNTRLNITAIKPVEYFSKTVIKEDIDESTPVNIPDAISPNGDGFNDEYVVVKRSPTDVIRFEVYSRNQVLVFQDLDYQNTFNGTGNMGGLIGNVLPDGIYYYLVSTNGSKGIPGYLIINR